MQLKIGDKVKMTKKGFKFYSNIDITFDTSSLAGIMEYKHFTQAVCELFAIHGVGTVVRFNDEGVPYIRWKYRLDGIKYHYQHYFQPEDVKKLSLLDKFIFKIQGRV
jgi:hypothetical protein